MLTPLTAEKLSLNEYQAMLLTSALITVIFGTLTHPCDTIKSNLQGDLGSLTRKNQVFGSGECSQIIPVQ